MVCALHTPSSSGAKNLHTSIFVGIGVKHPLAAGSVVEALCVHTGMQRCVGYMMSLL